MFSTGSDADMLVAGVPAAARVVREARLAGLSGCEIAAGEGWQPTATTRVEIERLGLNMPVSIGPVPTPRTGHYAVIRGDALPAAQDIASAMAGRNERIDGVEMATGGGVEEAIARARDAAEGATARLQAAGRAILRATSKPTDGIVSRHLNRPVSQTISAWFLRLPGFRPFHATIGTALLGIAMFLALLFGGKSGLVVGALLFQAASIFDGVDGEVARATWRTSAKGARMDSLVDAATNLSFLLGVALNLLFQHRTEAAMLGFLGLGLLAIGLVMIGGAAARISAPFSFDLVKDHYRSKSAASSRHLDPDAAKPFPIMQWLTFMTSRDFFALVFAVMIACGLAAQVLAMFAIAAAGWLVAVVIALMPRRALPG